jgi:hypothetical protein
LYNPVGYPWESVAHWSDRDRLKSLLDRWGGGAVADGADGVERDDLDGWQRFAHDIAARREPVGQGEGTRSQPVRFFLIGTAGTGKSRTVRSFVGAKRDVVRRSHLEKISLKRSMGTSRTILRKMEDDMNEDIRFCCQLGAPTGCASFQLRFGASTLHRLFSIPIGYCGPARNTNSEMHKVKKRRMKKAKMFIVDELSMIGRRMLGKMEFKVRDFLGDEPVAGAEPIMGNKDLVMCGDPKQCPPIGD